MSPYTQEVILPDGSCQQAAYQLQPWSLTASLERFRTGNDRYNDIFFSRLFKPGDREWRKGESNIMVEGLLMAANWAILDTIGKTIASSELLNGRQYVAVPATNPHKHRLRPGLSVAEQIAIVQDLHAIDPVEIDWRRAISFEGSTLDMAMLLDGTHLPQNHTGVEKGYSFAQIGSFLLSKAELMPHFPPNL